MAKRTLTIEDVLARLTTLLNSYDARITEIEEYRRSGVEGVHPAFFSGQLDAIITACVDLQAIVDNRDLVEVDSN